MERQQHFPRAYFQRYDERQDEAFYQEPRFVVHIDEWAITQLRNYYEQYLQDGHMLLDLMSSWRSHLPHALRPAHVSALGMNADEMADNPQINDYVVQNLNHAAQLPYDDHAFDAVLCAVSVQYLTDPVAVFREVGRVLKPGGRFIVSFSNRCFPSKAVAVWLSTSDNQHLALVTQYFELAGNFTAIDTQIKTSDHHDPMFIVSAQKISV